MMSPFVLGYFNRRSNITERAPCDLVPPLDPPNPMLVAGELSTRFSSWRCLGCRGIWSLKFIDIQDLDRDLAADLALDAYILRNFAFDSICNEIAGLDIALFGFLDESLGDQ